MAGERLSTKAPPGFPQGGAPERRNKANSLVAIGGRLGVFSMTYPQDIKVVHIYTAGFAETGDKEGGELQAEIERIVSSSDTWLIGPNCMGVYSTKGHLAYEPLLPKNPGNISLVFQSGDLHSQMIRISS